MRNGIRVRWGVAAGLLMVTLLALALSSPASAGTIDVTTTVDQLDGSAPCSLREAVNTANQDVDSGGCTDTVPFRVYDTINLAASDYNLSRFGVEDANASGDLDVTESLGIFGAGAGVSRIDGNGAITGDRVLQISAGNLAISGLTVRDGDSNTAGEGGGIAGNSLGGTTVTLTDSTVSDNVSEDGGGISGPTVTLTDSTVSGNHVTEGGGGIIASTVTLTDSTVSGNHAGDEGGGGIRASTVTLTDSTVSGNTAQHRGGGILTASATLTDSTRERQPLHRQRRRHLPRRQSARER